MKKLSTKIQESLNEGKAPKKGDKVSFTYLGDKFQGKVISIKGNNYKVETDDGDDIELKQNQMTIIESVNEGKKMWIKFKNADQVHSASRYLDEEGIDFEHEGSKKLTFKSEGDFDDAMGFLGTKDEFFGFDTNESINESKVTFKKGDKVTTLHGDGVVVGSASEGTRVQVELDNNMDIVNANPKNLKLKK